MKSLLYSFSGTSDNGNNSVFPSSLILDTGGQSLTAPPKETGTREYGFKSSNCHPPHTGHIRKKIWIT